MDICKINMVYVVKMTANGKFTSELISQIWLLVFNSFMLDPDIFGLRLVFCLPSRFVTLVTVLGAVVSYTGNIKTFLRSVLVPICCAST